jgi:ADP-heptose:LPS heptosyltransferase
MNIPITKISIVRTDKIGDMILTLPLIYQVKQTFPNSEISLISASYTNDVTENLPFIEKVFNKDKYENRLKNIFKEYKPDIIFFPRPRYDEIKDAFFAGIKHRIGSAYRWYSIMLNHKVKDHRKVSEFHEAEYNVRMLESFLNKHSSLIPPLSRGGKGVCSGDSLEELPLRHHSVMPPLLAKEGIEEKENSIIPPPFKGRGLGGGVDLPEIYFNPDINFDNLLEDNLKSGKKPIGFFIFHPGSGGSARDWSADRMGQLAQLISEKYNLLPIISGTKSESEKCGIAANHCPNALNLCDKMSLKMLKPFIKSSKLLISNSTGIIHIAASLKTPVIGFYPNTPHLSAKRWGPYTSDRLIISPSNHQDGTYNDDMNTISVNFAFNKILETNFLKRYE